MGGAAPRVFVARRAVLSRALSPIRSMCRHRVVLLRLPSTYQASSETMRCYQHKLSREGLAGRISWHAGSCPRMRVVVVSLREGGAGPLLVRRNSRGQLLLAAGGLCKPPTATLEPPTRKRLVAASRSHMHAMLSDWTVCRHPHALHAAARFRRCPPPLRPRCSVLRATDSPPCSSRVAGSDCGARAPCASGPSCPRPSFRSSRREPTRSGSSHADLTLFSFRAILFGSWSGWKS